MEGPRQAETAGSRRSSRDDGIQVLRRAAAALDGSRPRRVDCDSSICTTDWGWQIHRTEASRGTGGGRLRSR